MKLTRRELGSLALAAGPAVIIGRPGWAFGQAKPRPNSSFGGVEIGAISYSFRQIGYNPEDVLAAMVHLGLGALELEQSFFEAHLGAPRDPTGGGQPQGIGTVPSGPPFNRGAFAPPAARQGGAGGRGQGDAAAGRGQAEGAGAAAAGGGRAGGGGGGRGGLTPEQEAERAAVRAELKKWRLAAPWDKVRALKKLYDDAGVAIRLVKFPQLGGLEMSDEEVDYCFQMAKTFGARGLTCEPPLSQTKRIARFAEKHQMIVAFHNHSNVTSVEAFGRTGAWEQAFFYSKYHWANVDIGHFMAGNSKPPTEFLHEYHTRITNLHLKDRKVNNGPNLPWGEGDTPIRETLELMKRERWTFTASIELEYPIPQGSSVMGEMQKCVDYCKAALA